MPQRRAELVREIINSLNRADVDGVVARLHTDFEWTTLESSPVAGTYRGHAEVKRYVEDWLATFENLRIDLAELTEAGDEVLAVVRGHARGRASGIEVDNSYSQLWTVRDGAVLRMREYDTRDDALAALADASGPGGG